MARAKRCQICVAPERDVIDRKILSGDYSPTGTVLWLHEKRGYPITIYEALRSHRQHFHHLRTRS